ncbi:hypothetical protein Tco_0232921 [Tanacetum coccineum]
MQMADQLTQRAGCSTFFDCTDLIPKSEPLEQSSDDISTQDEGMTSDMEDTEQPLTFPRRTGKKKLCKADLEVTKSGKKLPYPVSKLKAARYLNFGIVEFSSIVVRRKNSISTYIVSSLIREAVKIRRCGILSVISVKVFEKYGYNYLREIILRRADYQEYKISEKDFKNLYPNDFEDLFLLNIQEKLNHLPKTDKISLHTA